MYKLLLLLLGYIICPPLAYPAQPIEIYTYDVLPPYAYRDEQGQLTGVYIEIVKTAVSRMPGYSLTYKVQPWARAKIAVKFGKAFAILPPYFHAHDWLTETKPKRPYIWPYSLPLYTQKDIVICNTEVMTQPRNNYPEDFEGLSFIMWRGDGRAGGAFDNMVSEKRIRVTLVDSIKDKIKLLLLGRFDCTVTSKLPFYWDVSQLKKSGKLKPLKEAVQLKQVAVISRNDGYLGYSDIDAEKNFPYKKDFSIKFDIEIYKMKQSGELNDIVNRFVNLKDIK